ncbi:MAG TPA: ATP-binding protein [Thermoanaerobaculia bacterium]|nr:ATP-binding protein [Thermoanaerobaculia bacterium]
MPRFVVPNSATLHNAKAFIERNRPFFGSSRNAILEFHPRWAHLDPMALSMIASWGAWCRREGLHVRVGNLGRHAHYAARMKLFQHLGVEFDPHIVEREEAGRFLPVTQVQDRQTLSAVIGDISALLHMDSDPDGLAAVQYCVSELIRNVLEHSGSDDGAFVCAHRYTKKRPHRITIAVADCGQGVAAHLGRAHPEALEDDVIALGLAMRPGVTGAIPGIYGTTDNAGAGLFITRSIAKGTGGYFLLYSGRAAYRLRRTKSAAKQIVLYLDPFDEPRRDVWRFRSRWSGTVVVVEIRTDRIADFQGFFQWIRRQMPTRTQTTRRIKFT